MPFTDSELFADDFAGDGPRRKKRVSVTGASSPLESMPSTFAAPPSYAGGEPDPNQPGPPSDPPPPPSDPPPSDPPKQPDYSGWGPYLPEGLDMGKVQSGHSSPKYQIARIQSHFDPKLGITPDVLGALNSLGIGTFSGQKDWLSVANGVPEFNDVLSADVIRDFGNGPWQGWGGGGEPSSADAWADPSGGFGFYDLASLMALFQQAPQQAPQPAPVYAPQPYYDVERTDPRDYVSAPQPVSMPVSITMPDTGPPPEYWASLLASLDRSAAPQAPPAPQSFDLSALTELLAQPEQTVAPEGPPPELALSAGAVPQAMQLLAMSMPQIAAQRGPSDPLVQAIRQLVGGSV